MTLSYLSTSHPPTVVTASICGHFSSHSELNLIVAKYNRIELFLITPSGLVSLLHFNISARVTNLAKFSRRRSKEYLIILTESLQLSILEYDNIDNIFITLCSGTISDRLKRSDCGEIVLKVDPTNEFVMCRVFDGVLKIISLDFDNSGVLNMYTVRINELYTIDLEFLISPNNNCLHIGIIYKDRLSRNFRSYLLRVRDMELLEGPLSLPEIEEDSALIMAVNSNYIQNYHKNSQNVHENINIDKNLQFNDKNNQNIHISDNIINSNQNNSQNLLNNDNSNQNINLNNNSHINNDLINLNSNDSHINIHNSNSNISNNNNDNKSLNINKNDKFDSNRNDFRNDAKNECKNDQFAGLLIVGRQVITYITKNETKMLSPPQLIGHDVIHVGCQIGRMNNPTFLFSDAGGNLYILSIDKEIYLAHIGQISFPATLTYIDNGVVFVGSCFGDSQLIKLCENSSQGSYFNIIQSFVNIGPIVDMELLNSPQHDVPRLITCSGVSKWGSLRILTNGIKIDEVAKFFYKYFKHVFALILSYPSNGFDDSVVFSNYDKTVILSENEGNFIVFEKNCFIYDSPTLFISNVINNCVVQVCNFEIRLVNVKNFEVISVWKSNNKISNVSCTGYQLAISSRNQIFLFSLDGALNLIGKRNFDSDISSLYISYISILDSSNYSSIHSNINKANLNSKGSSGSDKKSKSFNRVNYSVNDSESNFVSLSYIPNVMAISFWRRASIELYSLPDFSLLSMDSFDNNFLFKSLSIIEFRLNCAFLLAALGNGELFVYELKDPSNLLSVRSKTHVGTYPVNMVQFRVGGTYRSKEFIPGGKFLTNYPSLGKLHIFICTDRPTIIHYTSYKLGFSYTDKLNIESFCSYNSKVYNDCIILLSNDDITFSKLSDVSTCKVKTFPIYEGPRKIAYQAENSVLGLVTVRSDTAELRRKYLETPMNQRPISLRFDSINLANEEFPQAMLDVSNFVIIDSETFEPICFYAFPLYEIACSTTNCSLSALEMPLFAVGTGIVTDIEQEPTQGRVILFQYYKGSLTNITEFSTRGAVFDITNHDGKLICCVSFSVVILSIGSDNNLVNIYQVTNHVTTLFVKTLDNCVLVGDLIRSLSVYTANKVENQLTLDSCSDESNWLTAIEIINKDTFIYSNIDGCIFIASVPPQPKEKKTAPVAPSNLAIKLCYHLDQQINVFKKGSLTRSYNGQNDNPQNSIIFGTASGMIGTLVDIPSPWDKTLNYIQSRIIQKLESVGDIDYTSWRNQYAAKYDCKDTLTDGDIIEGFINLNLNAFKEIVSEVSGHFPSDLSLENRVDKVTAFIGDLSRFY